MRTPKLDVEIFEKAQDLKPAFTCHGTNHFGRCPHELANGTVYCQGQYLWIHRAQAATGTEDARPDPLSRWVWKVDPDAQTCPLKAMGLE